MLERYGIITGIMPSDGWRYEQPLPTGGFQRLPPTGCAGTDEALVEIVRNFRISAHIDLGEVALDVAVYIREKSPINDRFPGRAMKPVQSQASGYRPYIERIRDWLLVAGQRQPRLLIEDEADERAQVCIGCPHNVEWKTGCIPCCEPVVSRGQNVRQRASYKHDAKLKACRLHDLYLSTAVFLDREDLPPVNPNAPAPCWMHKIS